MKVNWDLLVKVMDRRWSEGCCNLIYWEITLEYGQDLRYLLVYLLKVNYLLVIWSFFNNILRKEGVYLGPLLWNLELKMLTYFLWKFRHLLGLMCSVF